MSEPKRASGTWCECGHTAGDHADGPCARSSACPCKAFEGEELPPPRRPGRVLLNDEEHRNGRRFNPDFDVAD